MTRKHLHSFGYFFAAGLIFLCLLLGACTPKPALSSISIVSSQPSSFQLGTTQQFTATATYSDLTTADVTSRVKWASSNTEVATVDQKGLVTAVSLGSTKITASLSGIISPAVTLPVVTIVSVAIEQKSPYKILVKGTLQFTAMATFSDGSNEDCTLSSKWASSAPTVAVITAIGALTANAPGTANITATLYGVTSAPLVLLVSAPPTGPSISSVAVSRDKVANLVVGSTQQFTAQALSTDGSVADVTSQATWSSSDQSVATVSSSGVVTGIGPGQANITAYYSGVTSVAIMVTVVSQ
jgi:trimeric autotransporter adhesin